MEGIMSGIGIIDCKPVMDTDGFWTEYTLYSDGNTYWCVFGDTDLYGPDAWHDWDGETLEEALEWFECYNGFEDWHDDCDREEPWDRTLYTEAMELWF